MKKNNARVSQQKAKRAARNNKRKKSMAKRITLPNGMTVPGNRTPGVKITSLDMLPQNVKEWVNEQGIELDLKPEESTEEAPENQSVEETKV